MAILNGVWPILMVIFGLGFVIFWHELGHFLLAKRHGVKVEKFSIGFGPALLKVRRGETEYALSAIPLGGFVKMLGEGTEEGEAKTADPRAYSNKSVGARMAIISAGVLMNVILGLACFVFAYRWGMDVYPTVIGTVAPGSPAYAAGIRAGDVIVAINGRRDVTFTDLKMASALSGRGEIVRLELTRPGRDEPIRVGVEPRRAGAASMPTIGLGQTHDLVLDEEEPWIDPLAGRAGTLIGQLKGGDQILRAGPQGGELSAVQTADELLRLMSRYQAVPLVVEVRRAKASGAPSASAGETTVATVTLPPNVFINCGFRLTIGPIAGVQGGSRAAAAGLQPGDVIRSVAGQDVDPMRLPSLCYEHAGSPLEFEVKRAKTGAIETLSITPDPAATPPWPVWDDLLWRSDSLLDVPGLGVCFPVLPRIAAIRPGSPAAQAGLKAGDEIQGLSVPRPKPKPGEKPTDEIKIDPASPSWVPVFALLQVLPRSEVRLTIAGSKTPVVLRPEPDPSWPNPMRGMRFQALVRPLPPQGVGQAIRRGLRDTRDSIVSIYFTIRGLVQGRVGKENIAGPVRIFSFGRRIAGMGLVPFIQFLGLLSVNLAVINFLPIPPLDGGQFLFLLAEKVRGRPLPDSALIAGTYAGLLLVLSLMVFVISQDIWLSL